MSISSSRISSDERWRSSIGARGAARRSARAVARSAEEPRRARGRAGRSKPVAMTVTRTSSPMVVVDHRAEDDVRVGRRGALDDLRGLVDLEQAQVAAAGDVEQDAGGALDGLLEQRARDRGLGRLRGAVLAGGLADAHERRAGVCMIVRTSAKSRLIRPGIVMRSVMPWTPWRRTSSASRNASRMLVRRSTIASSFSFGITMSVSTCSRRRSMPSSAWRALGALEVERLGDDADGQRADLVLGDLGDHRRGARAGAAALAGGDEDHVRALERLLDLVAALVGRAVADLGVGARAEALVSSCRS